MEQANKDYILYCHKNLANGKAYYGITCRSPEQRWGKNGMGYKPNTHFWNAIQKYGWSGFSHDILFRGLDSEKECFATACILIQCLLVKNIIIYQDVPCLTG